MQRITRSELKIIEQYADALFQEHGIDIEFQNLYKGTHFFDRLNDPRNESPITVPELKTLFRKISAKYGDQLGMETPNTQGVLKDMESNINVPFILKWDDSNRELDLVPKTIMKKRNFVAQGKAYRVESMKMYPLFVQLLEEYGSDTNSFSQFIPVIEKKLKIKVDKHLGSGSKSDAFLLKDGRVLKLTRGKNDAAGLAFAKEHPDYPVLKVFSIFKFKPFEIAMADIQKYKIRSAIDHPMDAVYVIISELTKTRRFTTNEEADLEDWFLENTPYKPDDIFTDNMGIRSDGTIVYIDPSFEGISSYISKIPNLF